MRNLPGLQSIRESPSVRYRNRDRLFCGELDCAPPIPMPIPIPGIFGRLRYSWGDAYAGVYRNHTPSGFKYLDGIEVQILQFGNDLDQGRDLLQNLN